MADSYRHDISPDSTTETRTEALGETQTINHEETEDLDEGELRASVSGEISIEKSDRSLNEFKRWHDEGDLIVDPEWQRNYVWSRKQASKLIESFLLNIPVPVIYLARTPESKYEVIDGLQRLTSVFEFLDNKWLSSNRCG